MAVSVLLFCLPIQNVKIFVATGQGNCLFAKMASRSGAKDSSIGRGSIFEGKFYISGSLRIDGRFEGDIKTEGSLIIGESGRLKTNIHAKEVIVAGTMIGDVVADEQIRLERTGKVLGNICAPTIHIAPGVMAQGSINITGDSDKSTDAVVEEAYKDEAEKAPDNRR